MKSSFMLSEIPCNCVQLKESQIIQLPPQRIEMKLILFGEHYVCLMLLSVEVIIDSSYHYFLFHPLK